MKIIAIIFSLVVLALGMHEHKRNVKAKVKIRISEVLDTSRYAILKLDNIPKNIFDQTYKPATLSDTEIIKIERLIEKKVSEINKEEKASGLFKSDYIGNPRKFYQQFIAVTNDKGEKEVWVNCCCTIFDRPDWKTQILLVFDGGSCFFNLKINLATNTVYDLMINGVG